MTVAKQKQPDHQARIEVMMLTPARKGASKIHCREIERPPEMDEILADSVLPDGTVRVWTVGAAQRRLDEEKPTSVVEAISVDSVVRKNVVPCVRVHVISRDMRVISGNRLDFLLERQASDPGFRARHKKPAKDNAKDTAEDIGLSVLPEVDYASMSGGDLKALKAETSRGIQRLKRYVAGCYDRRERPWHKNPSPSGEPSPLERLDPGRDGMLQIVGETFENISSDPDLDDRQRITAAHRMLKLLEATSILRDRGGDDVAAIGNYCQLVLRYYGEDRQRKESVVGVISGMENVVRTHYPDST